LKLKENHYIVITLIYCLVLMLVVLSGLADLSPKRKRKKEKKLS